MSRSVRYILAALCLAGAAFFLLPLAAGILHFGMVWPAAVLLLAAAVLLWPDFFRRLLRPVWLRRLVGCVAAVCMTVILVTLGKMASAALHHPTDGQDCTVVVLGCQVFPDGHPSLMLRGRINAAYDYLSAHPDAVCVASGGMDDSEPITEAQCIRDTLVSMGIDPGRIYMEDRSRSTEENLAFSAELIRANGLPTDVAIASDNFHQLRGAIWAERSGLTPETVLPMNVYACRKLQPLPLRGRAVVPREEHRPVMAALLRQMALDAEGQEVPEAAAADFAQAMVGSDRLLLWEDGDIRAMAMIAHIGGGMGRINTVVTERNSRGRGYAGMLTAALCEKLLAQGLTPMLYADAGNPSSNRAYQKIGMEARGQVTEYRWK